LEHICDLFKIVNKDSAILGLRGLQEIKFYLNFSHSIIYKLANGKELEWKVVFDNHQLVLRPENKLL
jgi:hypothetical protein